MARKRYFKHQSHTKITFFVYLGKIGHFSMNYLKKSRTHSGSRKKNYPLCLREKKETENPLIFHFIQICHLIELNESGVCASTAPRIKPTVTSPYCKNNPAATDSARLARPPELCRIQRHFIEMKFPKCSQNPYQSLESLLTNLLRIN